MNKLSESLKNEKKMFRFGRCLSLNVYSRRPDNPTIFGPQISASKMKSHGHRIGKMHGQV